MGVVLWGGGARGALAWPVRVVMCRYGIDRQRPAVHGRAEQSGCPFSRVVRCSQQYGGGQ